MVPFWSHRPILEPILVGIGMFTGGTIWIWTHGQIALSSPLQSGFDGVKQQGLREMDPLERFLREALP